MAKQYCEDSNGRSSAPVPIIGLYIAGASLVCLLLMLWDIYVAFRRKHFHILCRRFKLNSVTLTLLAIVAKLPVDLTTDMPSAADQLSKLTGTAMICICIGFMAPSLASSTESEDIANVASLGIFIVTVVVNICVQMGTGVIFSFVPEHIIIMCFMFMLLLILWCLIGVDKELISEYNVGGFYQVDHEDEEVSFIQRVKSWYVSACIFNPQLFICKQEFSTTVGPICITCSLVLLQSICRAIVGGTIEFCTGVSDYGWSIWIVVITQIVTIIIGALTIAFRWLVIFHYFDTNFCHIRARMVLNSIKLMFLKGELNMLSRMSELMWLLFDVSLIFVSVPTHAISLIISRIPSRIKLKLRCCMHKPREDILSSFPWIKKYYAEEMKDDELVQRAIEVCVENMNQWRNIVKRDPSPYHHTIDMLSKLGCSATSPQLLNRFRDMGRDLYPTKEYNVTSFTMVVLVKAVTAFVLDPSIPLVKSMIDTLDEAFEIVHYVDRKMNVKIKDSERQKLAEKLWKDDEDCEIATEEVPEMEEEVVSYFIGRRPFEDVEQLFCEMLHHFLAHLPICVYKDVHEGAVEDCEKRAKYITKCLCEMNPLLEGLVQWKFPDGWRPNSSRIFDLPQGASQHSNAQNHMSSTEDAANITNITATALNVTDQQQHPSDQIQPAGASSNVWT